MVTLIHLTLIFRLNMAPIKGYESDVGTKTTVRAVYPESSNIGSNAYTQNWTLLVVPFKTSDLKWVDTVIEGRDLVSFPTAICTQSLANLFSLGQNIVHTLLYVACLTQNISQYCADSNWVGLNFHAWHCIFL